ncbi:hypothetical protein BDF19DRAFT_416925 [Syncephalis fuscata]|nr:hypothetical protein BDF19DRAFT_416925 [Syncephalis fuscata]
MGWPNTGTRTTVTTTDTNAFDISGFPWDSARILLITCIIGVLAGCFYYAWTSARDALRELRALERHHLHDSSSTNGYGYRKGITSTAASRPASPAAMALLAGAALRELEEKRRRASPHRHRGRDAGSPPLPPCRTPSPSPSRSFLPSTATTHHHSSISVGLGVRGIPLASPPGTPTPIAATKSNYKSNHHYTSSPKPTVVLKRSSMDETGIKEQH